MPLDDFIDIGSEVVDSALDMLPDGSPNKKSNKNSDPDTHRNSLFWIVLVSASVGGFLLVFFA